MKSSLYILTFTLIFGIIFIQCSAQAPPVTCNFNEALKLAQCCCFFTLFLEADNQTLRQQCQENTGRAVSVSQDACEAFLFRNGIYDSAMVFENVRQTRALCGPNETNDVQPPYFTDRVSDTDTVTDAQLLTMYNILVGVIPEQIR